MTPRCYLVTDLLPMLKIKRSQFHELLRQGKLPFLEELQPRVGGRARYRADLVDRYFAGQWGRPRSFASGRKAG